MLLSLPNWFAFSSRGQMDIDRTLSFFKWDIINDYVTIDLRNCHRANYQSISLIILYCMYLKSCDNYVNIKYTNDRYSSGASKMWRKINGNSWLNVNRAQFKFNFSYDKPIFALTNNNLIEAIDKSEEYTREFGIDYKNTLRYVLAELFYNAIEHGKTLRAINNLGIPPIVQYTWYRERNELHFIVADIGVGIKQHLEQTYNPFDSDATAIVEAIKPNVSGTFGSRDMYSVSNNAGMGLYISTNIIKKLHADMYIVSQNGLVHISPVDITEKTIVNGWPGTFAYLKIKLDRSNKFSYEHLLADLRKSASEELSEKEINENDLEYYLSVYNFFGSKAEGKFEGMAHRDKYIIPAVAAGKTIKIDFKDVEYAPHSFLNAMLATPINMLGMGAYKKIKIFNAQPSIRDTLDFIFDENTN
ncbi:DUF4325 domain-containing protein [uncultured Desulfovibrio sp.]|uniref:STAS-like domain-containing protein n=1 Tax=uncultured Desulfovibrio sp. TaxID=167968 RepID=UPI00262A5BCE|nr:DUF4325 domain-containing protein [uncultured Desulfovibrio sp.]